MLDLKYVIAHADEVKANCRNRCVAQDIIDEVDQIVRLDAERRELTQAVEEVRRRQNEIAQATSKEKNPDARARLVAEGRALKDSIADREASLKALEDDLKRRLARIPNRTHPDAPIGRTEEDSRELRRVGSIPTFTFPPKDHVELGKALDLIDFESAAKVSGHGFYFLKNDAVLLDLALQRFAIDLLIRKGYTPVVTPDLARNAILEGIGFAPRGPETQVYSIEDTDLSLVGTAEITLGGLHADDLLDEADLPIRYVGLSHCFRTEAGAAGRASKGLYRVHQFTKVEMFVFSTPETSDALHKELLAIEEEIFQALGIPYRVLDICTGDLGGPAARKFDLEAWMPGRGEGGEYGEITSTSDCWDYQSRRLNVRYRPIDKNQKPRFVHTLNGTAIAISRALIALMENHQTAHGAIVIPEPLRPYVGKDVIGPPA
ncbi:seryl-tRNA synthetase [Isosphaera pallida ATCC 43644]|uniref:Serine--tRNA ligase n=1 Tax=Isosphaera pallida (strain ATCC 43644 / DSM 9630 / IS1B) TaxID=575540 RepID=E8QZW9_ISOPI|nr:serine--tRNA ligase [Isosphaera pallida]ADV63260.1 seryl-tRNA synthetase [Isosphaera pallida ATCC 43644]